MIDVRAIESAAVIMDASAYNLIIILANPIKIGKNSVRKILISEELIEDYGRISPSGNFVIDIDVPNRKKGYKII